MLAHEQVFWTDGSGKLNDLGYSPADPGTIPEGWIDPRTGEKFNDMPFDSFRFNPQRYHTPPELLFNAIPTPFNSGQNYRLLGTNCQVFASCMRATTTPK